MKRTTRGLLAACVAASLVLGITGIAFANDTAVNGIGGSLTPMESTDIRMAAETIQAHVYRDYAEFVVDFEFENFGESQTLKLGFPFRERSGEEIANDSPGGALVAGFQAWQDGVPIDVAYEEGSDSNGEAVGYFVHEVTFEPGTTMVRVRYLADASADTGWPPQSLPRPAWAEGIAGGMHEWYPYWVHTGAGWAGTIGTTVVRFTLTDDFIGWGADEAMESDGVAGYTKLSESEYQWVMSDYEPTLADDPRLSFFSSTPEGMPEDWPTEYARATIIDREASSQLVLGEYAYPAWQAFAGVSTSWAEAVTGSGSGEWAKATFGAAREVSEVRILPGYAKRPDLFYKYNRPKTLTLTFSDGTVTTVTLADEPSLQRFPVTATAEWVTVAIGDVYRGTVRDETYLSFVDVGAASPEYLSFESLLAEAGAEPAEEPTQDEESTESVEPTSVTDEDATDEEPGPSVALIIAIAVGVMFAGVVLWLLIKRAKLAPKA